jgi:hypothetical protein
MELREEDLLQFLCQYPIVVKHVSRLGPNRYRIDGPFDLYELTIVNKASGLLRANVSDYAAKHGFWRSQRFIRSLYGEPVVEVGSGDVLCLTDWFAGAPCAPVGNNLVDVVQTLARLHNALCGASTAILNLDSMSGLPLLTQKKESELFLQQTNVLEAALLKFRRTREKDVFIKWLEEAEMRAKWLLPIFQQYTTPASKSICWNIEAFHQFIRFSNGRVGILQNADPKVCTTLFDLSVLVSEGCRAGGEESVQAILDAYREIVPLGSADVNFVLACSAFPIGVPEYFKREQTLQVSVEQCHALTQMFAKEAQAAHRLMRMIRFPQ